MKGPSGSGKTLLLRALAWLDPLQSGELFWIGAALRGNNVPSFRRQVIYVHQTPVLQEGTVEDNLRRPYSLQIHSGDSFNLQRTIQWLERTGRKSDFLDLQARHLSGGESQLVALLRALQLRPRVLLLDEPTAAVDGEGALAVEAIVREWHTEDSDERAYVWVSHDSKQAQRVANRFWRVDQGRLQQTSALTDDQL